MKRNEKTNGKYRCRKKIIIDCNAVKGNVYFFLFGWRAGLEKIEIPKSSLVGILGKWGF
jgi:hypothetical protein